MLELLLSIGTLAIFGTGYFIWQLGRRGNGERPSEAPARRREDARDWQRHFGADSALNANFLQPTQNEILETLYVLDHLTPGWETGDNASVERHLLNELALSFPSLRKAKCAFPLPFAETLAAGNMSRLTKRKQAVTEEEIAAQRESFQTERAHFNALEQIVGGSIGPAEVAPGSLPFRASVEQPAARARGSWSGVFAAAAVLIAALLGVSYFHDGKVSLKNEDVSLIEPTSSPATAAAVDPAPATMETAEHVTAVSPTVTPESATTTAPVEVSTPPPVAAPSAEKVALNSRIAASQQRAVSKYPALAVEGSEINLRFVFRYKNLVQENSPRLLDPAWPEQLAEECAAAAAASPKHGALTQVAGARR